MASAKINRLFEESKFVLTATKFSFNPHTDNNFNNNNKIWILFAMSAYSFDKLKFTSAREKWKEKENDTQKHQKFTMHKPPEQ